MGNHAPDLSGWFAAVLALGLFALSSAKVPGQTPDTLAAVKNFGQLPLYFEANQGQADPDVHFVARGCEQSIYLHADGATIGLQQEKSSGTRTRPHQFRSEGGGTVRFVRLSLPGGDPRSSGDGLEKFPSQVNYLLGNDPARWRTSVDTFARVRYRQVYPGVDLVYYGNNQRLEFDFVVAPGADPSGIALRFAGADRLEIDEGGDLVLQVGNRQLRQHQPVAYQTGAGVRHEIPARYELKDARTVSIATGHYDPGQPLVIDPVLSYSTYLGGNKGDIGWAIAADAAGYAYVAGETLSIFTRLPLSGFQTEYGGGTKYGGDAFVAKLDPTGTSLAYLTYLGGSQLDGAVGIAVDSAGCAYITGYTDSTNFPTYGPSGILQPAIAGTNNAVFKVHFPDAFVTKLDTNGQAVYSTYLGGELSETAADIAVDPSGCAYVVGYTESALVYRTTNRVCTTGCTNNICATTSSCVTNITLSRVLVTNSLVTNVVSSQVISNGPPVTNVVENIVAVSLLGAELVTFGFPTTNAWQANNHGGANLFVSKLSPDGARLVYSTYLGGEAGDFGTGIAVDPAGNVTVSGWTDSIAFPVTNAIQPVLAGGKDALIAKLDATGTNLIYATYLGGAHDDRGYRLAVDAAGCAYVTGAEGSTDFPSTPGALNKGGIFQSVNAGTNWNLSSSGLTHTIVQTLLIDPTSPGTLYAGTPRGVFKTTDGGVSWRASNTGMVNRAVTALAIDATTPSTIYAGTLTGLFKSTNGGATWASSSFGLTSTSIRTILFEPGSSATLYVGTAGGVFKRTDPATNWTTLNSGLKNRSVHGLVISPAVPTTLYAATDGGVYKSTNGGAQWRSSNTGLKSTRARAIALNPSNPDILYVGTAKGIHWSINAATNWALLTNGLGQPSVNTLLIDPALPSSLYTGTTNGLFKSVDAGASWTRTDAGLQTLDVTALTFSALDALHLYAGTRGTNFAGGTNDAFLVKLAADGSTLVYADTLGGNRNDEGWGVAVDSAGSAFVVGFTASRNFPIAGASSPSQTNLAGKTDVFIARFDPTGASNIFSIYLGGKSDDLGHGIALDPAGGAYIVGRTFSAKFPTTNAVQSSFGSGSRDAFVAKFLATPSLLVTPAGDNVQVSWPAPATEFILESCDATAGRWQPVAPQPVWANGRHTVLLPAASASCLFRLRVRAP